MKHNPDFVARHVNEEIILVPISRASAEPANIFTLNEVGARIWHLSEIHDTPEEIAQVLVQEYDVSPQQALADTQELLAQLRSIGAIVD